MAGSEHRQGQGKRLVKLVRLGPNLVRVTSRSLGYPIDLHVTKELIDFLKGEDHEAPPPPTPPVS